MNSFAFNNIMIPLLHGFIVIAKGVVIFEVYTDELVIDINEIASIFQSIDIFSQLEHGEKQRPNEIQFKDFSVTFQKSMQYNIYYGLITQPIIRYAETTNILIATSTMFEQQFATELQQENYSSFFLNFSFISKLKQMLQQINVKYIKNEQQRVSQIESEFQRPKITRID